MNNGKLCVSVCAETADEMSAKIKRAEEFADVIEVRFDCLDPKEIATIINLTVHGGFKKPLVATYRGPSEGGFGSAKFEDRVEFWNKIPKNFGIGDLEGDITSVASDLNQSINSFHDNYGVPPKVEELYYGMSEEADVWKIAVTAKDVSDPIPVWQLLERAREGNRKFVPIAMGEAGKWTRLLGLAHGAFLTYASLDDGDETAPGQINIQDMTETYRVKELDLDTKVYGVIGDPVSESLSPYMHNAAFVVQNINAVFIPLQVKDIDEFMRRMVKRETREVELNFHGFAVTMPHKQAIIKHLDDIDSVAQKIGAVNTVNICDGKLIGYNTDAYGFITPLLETLDDLKGERVAIFGAGGAARACAFALGEQNAEVTIMARDLQKARSLATDLGVMSAELRADGYYDFDILINATPLGMKGVFENDSPFTVVQLDGVKLVYDLVTSPADTPLIREAKRTGIPTINGIEMLLHQGAKQFEIWTGCHTPLEKMRKAIDKKIG